MSTSKEFINNLKIGDKVVLELWGRWCKSSYTIEKVEKITPSGLVKVNGILFYPDGNARGNYNAKIYDANISENLELVKETENEMFIRQTVNKIKKFRWDLISYEEAKELDYLLNKFINRISNQ